jgi:hypothetical protein
VSVKGSGWNQLVGQTVLWFDFVLAIYIQSRRKDSGRPVTCPGGGGKNTCKILAVKLNGKVPLEERS